MNQWSFDVERALWRNAGLDIQYLGSQSVHLDRSYYINQPQPGPGPVNPRRPNQLFGQIRVIQNDEAATYQGLNVVFRQNMSHGLTSLLSYTWSHALDVSTDSNGGGAPMDPFNWKRDYSNSNWDVRHRFVASYTYDLPFFRASTQPLVKYGLANWQVNGITTIQTGFPFNVVVSGDIANNGLTLGNHAQTSSVRRAQIAARGTSRTASRSTLSRFPRNSHMAMPAGIFSTAPTWWTSLFHCSRISRFGSARTSSYAARSLICSITRRSRIQPQH